MNQALAFTEPDCIRPPAPEATELLLVDDKLAWQQPGQPGRRATIHYRLHGPATAPVVGVLGGISANRQVQCWWRDLYGSERALNPERIRILTLDWLGHGEQVSTQIQADALVAVLDHLALPRLDVLIGASYGAMVGLCFAARHGQRLGRLLAISGAERARPANVALRHIQREILRFGADTGQRERAVALARALAMTTYRPAEQFDERFAAESSEQTLAEVSAYLDHVGRCFSSNFSAEHYTSLSNSLDRHEVNPDRLVLPVDLVAVDSDTLVPPGQIEALAARLPGSVRLHHIQSPYGHDAFLKEPACFNRLIHRLLAEEGIA